MLHRCPNCGSLEGYSYSDYGIVHEYEGIFGQGKKGETEVCKYRTRPEPIFAKCLRCKKQIKLTDLR